MRKTRSKVHHIEARNEVGEMVFFEMPFAAMYFNTGQVTDQQENGLRNRQEKMATQYCALADKPDSIFSDLDGKERFVNKLQRKGVWV